MLGAYHDQEWGVPLHDDPKLFELLTLEGAQAGLSWLSVLKRREAYRRAFVGFVPARVAAFGEADVRRLLADPGLIRNRQKIIATIHNANCVIAAQREFGSLDALVWSFVESNPIVGRRHAPDEVPARTSESERMSRVLSQRGFGFVGPTICYAFMQAAGLVNDHLVDCPAFAGPISS